MNLRAFNLGRAFAMGQNVAAMVQKSNMAQDVKVRKLNGRNIRWVTINGARVPLDLNGFPASKKWRERLEKTQGGSNYKLRNAYGLYKQRKENARYTFGQKSEKDRTFTDPRLMHLQARYDEICKEGDRIFSDIQEICDSVGATTFGKESGIKSASSTQRKTLTRAKELAKKRKQVEPTVQDVDEAFNSLGDLVRFTAYGKQKKLVDLKDELEQKLVEKGYNIAKRENKYVLSAKLEDGTRNPKAFYPDDTKMPNTYKAIHLDVQDPKTGITFELQIHSPDSMPVKLKNHLIYEETRKGEMTLEQQKKLDRKMARNWRNVLNPNKIRDVRNFKSNDKEKEIGETRKKKRKSV